MAYLRARFLRRLGVGSLLAGGLLLVIVRPNTKRLTHQRKLKGYELPFGQRWFWPARALTADGRFVSAEAMANSRFCGSCHTDIYEQWRDSMHAHAATNLFYRKTVLLRQKEKGEKGVRFCGGCHDLVPLFAGQLSAGRPALETPGIEEGISCIACHGIVHADPEEGNAAYVLDIEREIFPFRSNLLAEATHRGTIMLIRDLHRRRFLKPLHKTAEFCGGCHEVFLNEDMNGWGFIKMQSTYQEWATGYFGPKGYGPKTKVCQDCHMPKEPLDDPVAPKREGGLVRSHHFAAANDIFPLLTGNKRQVERVHRFLKENAATLEVSVPPRVSSASLVPLEVVVGNKGAGHELPTGTRDVTEIWVEVKVTDSWGRTVFHTGFLDEEGHVRGETLLLTQIPVDREGNRVYKRAGWHVVGTAYNRAIRPRRRQRHFYALRAPEAKGELEVLVRLNYRKFNQLYVNWVRGDEDFALPEEDVRRNLSPEMLRRFRGPDPFISPLLILAQTRRAIRVE